MVQPDRPQRTINMAHAHCMLDTEGHKHTRRICNTDVAFPRQEWLRERILMLHYTYICVVSISSDEPEWLWLWSGRLTANSDSRFGFFSDFGMCILIYLCNILLFFWQIEILVYSVSFRLGSWRAISGVPCRDCGRWSSSADRADPGSVSG